MMVLTLRRLKLSRFIIKLTHDELSDILGYIDLCVSEGYVPTDGMEKIVESWKEGLESHNDDVVLWDSTPEIV